MNRFWTFILGVVFGITVIPFILSVIRNNASMDGYNNPYDIEGLAMLEKEGDCITSNNLSIFQTLTRGIALARPAGDYDNFMLLIDENERLFYDGEKIKNPTNHCAKQIGVYQYETKAGLMKTVPAVMIRENK